MALTFRSNGNSPANLVGANWWNDYYNLLTGAMTDQPVTLSYAPGSSTTTPTLLVKSNGNAPLLLGYNGGTQEFALDQYGNLTLIGQLQFPGGAYVKSNASDDVLVAPASGHWTYLNYNGTGSGSVCKNDGFLYDMNGHAYTIIVATVGTAGRQIFVGTTTPTGANEGDIWVKA